MSEVFTADDVQVIMRKVWEATTEGFNGDCCECESLRVFRIPRTEIDELHEKHLARTFEEVLAEFHQEKA